MSAPLPSLLADKLNVSNEKAKKLLIAMLREVRKRAFREGVCLPEFGTFREQDGQLTFEPSSSLARSVNEQFEGLESEDLSTAPTQESEEEEDADEGPDTITLGYQDSDWTPLDSEEKEADEADADTDDDAADTAEFQVPAAEEAADTDELQAAAPDDEPAARDRDPDSQTSDVETKSSAQSSPPDPSSDSADRSQTQTEELYPLVEDVPGSSDAEGEEPSPDQQHQSAEEEQRESLSGIWSPAEEDESDESEEGESVPNTESESLPRSGSAAQTEPVVDPEPEPDSSSSHPDAQPTSEVNIEPDAREATPPNESTDADATEPKEPATKEPATADEERSTGVLVLSGVLVLLLLGGASWYVLGNRGIVQPPQKTFAQLKAQVQPHIETLSAKVGHLSTEDIPLVGPSSSTTNPSTADAASDASSDSDQQDTQTSETSSRSTASSPSTPEPTADSPSSEPGQASSEATDTSPTTESATTDPSNDTAAPSSQGLAPEAGGYTVIVGSRTQRGPAESLLQNYRKVFATSDVPVGIVSGEVNGKTRYRIGVGQFESQAKAQDFAERASAKLPEGAWVLRL